MMQNKIKMRKLMRIYINRLLLMLRYAEDRAGRFEG